MNRILSHLIKLIRVFRYGDSIRPQRDWLVVMLIAGVLLIGSASWSYYLFGRISGGDLLGGHSQTVAPVDTASLETVRAVFEARAAERERYRSEYRFVDPSK